MTRMVASEMMSGRFRRGVSRRRTMEPSSDALHPQTRPNRISHPFPKFRRGQNRGTCRARKARQSWLSGPGPLVAAQDQPFEDERVGRLGEGIVEPGGTGLRCGVVAGIGG